MTAVAELEPNDPFGEVLDRVVAAWRTTWLAAVESDPAVPGEAEMVAEALARHLTRHHLVPAVSGHRLADLTGLEDQTVWWALRLLEERGHLVRIKAPPRPNAYGLTLLPSLRYPNELRRQA